MPSKGRYTAGKQVSRWEADSDNIDIEYKNLEGQSHGHSFCSCPSGNKKPYVIKFLCVSVVFGIGLVLGYLVRKNVYKNDGIPSHTEHTEKPDFFGIKQVSSSRAVRIV